MAKLKVFVQTKINYPNKDESLYAELTFLSSALSNSEESEALYVKQAVIWTIHRCSITMSKNDLKISIPNWTIEQNWFKVLLSKFGNIRTNVCFSSFSFLINNSLFFWYRQRLFGSYLSKYVRRIHMKYDANEKWTIDLYFRNFKSKSSLASFIVFFRCQLRR